MIRVFALFLIGCQHASDDSSTVRQGEAEQGWSMKVIDVAYDEIDCGNDQGEVAATLDEIPHGISIAVCTLGGDYEICTPSTDWALKGLDLEVNCDALSSRDVHLLISYW